jgi:hypothetical protein
MQEHALHHRAKDFAKKSLFAVDEARERDIFVIPPEAGPETNQGGSGNFWDCKLNSILSRHDDSCQTG